MSWTIEFNLGAEIPLDQLAAPNGGGTVGLPAALGNVAGIYLILNQNGGGENRYMGVSFSLQERFRARQAVIFELGLSRADLANIYAFTGVVDYTDDTVVPAVWNTSISTSNINGTWIDNEHLFIKAVQNLFPGTFTNTQKTTPFSNQTGVQLNVHVNSTWGGAPDNRNLILPAGAALP